MFASHTSVYFCCQSQCCQNRTEESHSRAKKFTDQLFKGHGEPESHVYDQMWQLFAVINAYVESLRELECKVDITKDSDNPKYSLVFIKPELLDMSIFSHATKSNQHHGAPDRAGGLISNVLYDPYRNTLTIEFIKRTTARKADYKFAPLTSATFDSNQQQPSIDPSPSEYVGKIKSSPRTAMTMSMPYRRQTIDQAHNNLMIKIKRFDYTNVTLLSALERWKGQPAHRPLAYFTLFFQSINASRKPENINVIVASTSKDHITFTVTMKTILPITLSHASYLISALDSAPLTQLKVTFNVEVNRFVCELKGDF